MRSTLSRGAHTHRAPVLALLAAVVATMAIVVVVPAAGAATRTLTVSPASALVDQAVTVSWRGFTPTTDTGLNQVIVLQCKGTPKSLDDCFNAAPFPNSANGNEIVNGVTLPNGTGSARLEIRPAAQLPELGCSEAHPCSVLAFENQVVPAGHLPTLSAIAPITFARSTADCPPVTNFDVRAEGEASAAPVIYDWAAHRCTGTDPIVVDYTETSSDSGRSDYLQRLVNVGVTSVAATPAELAAAPQYPKFAYAPLDLTAITVAYNIKDPLTNQPITDLTLSPRLLARLITDSDVTTFFQDPEFKRLNPHHTWPTAGASTPLLRAEANADTWFTTGWIAADKNAAAFLRGADPNHIAINSAFQGVPYPTAIFENRALDDAYLPRQGEYQVVTHVFYGARPADTSPLDPGTVGFMGVVDLAAAQRFNLPTAKLVNASGRAIAPTPASILAGYHAMRAGPGETLVPNFASTDPTAYPLVKVDYAMVPTTTDAAHQKHIADLLTWGATTGQTELPEGYLPLPSELVDRTKQVAGSIGATKTPTTTPTTKPTTTTTVSPTSSTTVPLVTSNSAGSCCASSGASVGDSFGAGSSPTGVLAGSSPLGSALGATSAAKGASHPKSTTAGGTPVATTTPATSPATPQAVIAAAAAPVALPVILGSGLLAGLVVAGRRLWPRMGRTRRLLARLAQLAKLRRTPSGAV